jgi:uncharacterized protein YqeY
MLREKIQQQIFAAMKEGKKDEVEALRFLMARIKNLEVDKKSELNDDGVLTLIQKIVKELDESIASFEKGGRSDLIERSKKQKEIFSQFLPPLLSDAELEAELKKIIKQNQEIYQKNKKAIIGIAVKALRSRIASEKIVAKLNEILS